MKTPRTDDGTQGRPRCAVADEIKAGDVDTLSMEKVDTPSDCSELDDNLGAQWLHVHAGVGEEGAECGVCDVEDGEGSRTVLANVATSAAAAATVCHAVSIAAIGLLVAAGANLALLAAPYNKKQQHIYTWKNAGPHVN